MIRAERLRLGLLPPSVDRVSLSIESGEIVGLLDPQGALASRLLRLLAGLEFADADTLTVANLDALASPADVQRAVGYLGTDLDVCFGASAREDLCLIASLRGIDFGVVDGVIELMELGGAADLPFAQLSRSQRLRLGLARLLLHDPPVLLLDEPFAHLDAVGRDDLCDQLGELARMGRTVVLHSQANDRLDGLCHALFSLDTQGLRRVGAEEDAP